MEKEIFLYKAIQEEIKISEVVGQSWISNIKEILENYGLSNLMINIFKVTRGEVEPKNYKPKHTFTVFTEKELSITLYNKNPIHT